MSTVDRSVVLEALSALTGSTVSAKSEKPNFRSATITTAALENLNELNIYNFITATLFQESGTGTVKCQTSLQAGNFSSGLRTELIVDIDKFFDPKYDHDFTSCTDTSVCTRGNEPYKRPIGWNRIAIKVLDKYPDGNTWLGTDGWRPGSVAGEWPVSYHGTSIEGVRGITGDHYKPGPRQVYGRGIYSTYDIDEANPYCKEFTSTTNGKKYRVIMQNRINPQMRTQCDRESYWLIRIPDGTPPAQEKEIVMKSIRPYGILLKQVS